MRFTLIETSGKIIILYTYPDIQYFECDRYDNILWLNNKLFQIYSLLDIRLECISIFVVSRNNLKRFSVIYDLI